MANLPFLLDALVGCESFFGRNSRPIGQLRNVFCIPAPVSEAPHPQPQRICGPEGRDTAARNMKISDLADSAPTAAHDTKNRLNSNAAMGSYCYAARRAGTPFPRGTAWRPMVSTASNGPA